MSGTHDGTIYLETSGLATKFTYAVVPEPAVRGIVLLGLFTIVGGKIVTRKGL